MQICTKLYTFGSSTPHSVDFLTFANYNKIIHLPKNLSSIVRKIRMKHAITFRNQVNHWDNGLPLGNGVFGCMVYYDRNRLHLPMNHYEVYYNISDHVLPEDQLKALGEVTDPGSVRATRTKIADGNAPKEGEPFYYYRKQRNPTAETSALNRPLQTNGNSYAIGQFSGSYPATGNITYTFADSLKDADSLLALYTEDANAHFSLEQDGNRLTLDTIVAREDCIISHVTQTHTGLVTAITLDMEPYRDLDAPEVTFTQIDSHTFGYSVTRMLGKKPFRFAAVLELVGAEGTMTSTDYSATIQLNGDARDFHTVTSVVTDFRYTDVLADGIAQSRKYAAALPALYEAHADYWKQFFAASSITLPDKFLEHIYYINQYALDCCSGENGVMKHHACGLNGLWAVKHPNLWGSMWYWDVNIQAAFAGVFSSNRMNLAKVFSDGLRCYLELARKGAWSVHGMTGLAADYPYDFYHCVWPWCAQYLWFLYEYTLDETYLREEAYPVFLELCEFMTQAFVYDATTDRYHIYPDISPEQGPLAHNTTITVASTKYLLQFTLEAAAILDDHSPILDKCRTLLEKLPEYAFTAPDRYGIHLKDSPDAPDHLWLRHPSMLMPLFPIGEFGLDSDPETQKLLSNTIDYLEDNCEIGIFGGSWLAAGAARLGRGQTALRLIYEKGVDHMLRSNGLTAEQTDRFINFCLTARQPLYYPCMMEFTGEMLAAVNEMLLQSHNGLIRIFPALPDGNPEMERMLRRGQGLNEYYDRYVDYEAWDTVRFDTMLAKGAFEVSAERKDGHLAWIRIHSQKGGTARVTCPFFTENMQVFAYGAAIPFIYADGIITFDTVPGTTYLIAETADAYTAPEAQCYEDSVLTRRTYTRRSIFLGEDKDTAYYKALDHFLRAWYYGNLRMENRTVFKFDFGCAENKNYADAFPRQVNAAESMTMAYLPFLPVSPLEFTVKRGFGFEDASAVTTADRGAPDLLRRDFAEGSEEAVFCMEVPRGQYELLVVSGDEAEDSISYVWAENGRSTGGEVVKKGHYQTKLLPLVLEEDGQIRLHISTRPGYRWKLNNVFVNAVKGY